MIRRLVFPALCRVKSVHTLYNNSSRALTGASDSGHLNASVAIEKLTSLVDSKQKWENIDVDSQTLFLNVAKSLPKKRCNSDLNRKYARAREGFLFHLRMVLDNITEGFVIKEDYAGFIPELSMDFAIFHESDLLGFVVIDEPEHFAEDGSYLPHHRIKDLIHDLKYYDNVAMCHINISKILDDGSRNKTIIKLVKELVDVEHQPESVNENS